MTLCQAPPLHSADGKSAPRREFIHSGAATVLEPRVIGGCWSGWPGQAGEVVTRDELIDDCWVARIARTTPLTAQYSAFRKGRRTLTGGRDFTLETIPKAGLTGLLATQPSEGTRWPVGQRRGVPPLDQNKKHDSARPALSAKPPRTRQSPPASR